MLSKTSVSIAAAGAGLCFLGYCIYFDRKRRNDPDFKKKLRERRNKAKASSSSSSGAKVELPDMSNPGEVQKFFFKEMQLGEELLNSGDLEAGIEHLGNALVISGQTSQLLGILQQTLAPQIFTLLVQSLPTAAKRLASSMGTEDGPPVQTRSGPTITTLKEDDVE